MLETAYADLASLVGKTVGPSDWYLVDQDRVNRFAEATGDFQWIHVDVERATRELGTPIAHGYLTLSMIPVMGSGLSRVTGVARAINYGSDKVRFITPVPVGSRLRLSETCLSVSEKAGGLQMVKSVTVELEGAAKPALIAETITVFYPA